MASNSTPGKIALRKLTGNIPAMSGLIIIAMAIIVSVAGALIRKDQSPDANNMLLSIARQKPGFSIEMLKLNKPFQNESKPWYKGLFFGGFEPEYDRIPVTDVRIIGDSLAYSAFAGQDESSLSEVRISLSQLYNPDKLTRNALIKSSCYLSKEVFYLGTDKYGRDLLSRLMAGTIVSLSVGFVAVFISLLVGIFFGALAGYYKGTTDRVISWFIQVIWSVPTLLLVMAITLVLGKGFTQIFIAVGLTMWVEVARVTRGQFLALREKEFVEAARALGYSDRRIIFRHLLPNAAGPLIVISASNFATAILIEAGLSFLGIGAQPPQASWGSMIKDHYGYIILDKAYLALAPGLAITLLVLAFTLLGNGLRDVLDSRAK